jgi:hypothetical protein
MYSILPLFAFLMAALQFVLVVLAIYVLWVFLKALQIYIRNNS